jgi:hypothetical protein
MEKTLYVFSMDAGNAHTSSAWSHRAYGSITDPIHKSHLEVLNGPYGCSKKFWYKRTHTAIREVTGGRAALGTATHEVLRVALTSTRSGARSWESEIREALAELGPIEWYDDDPERLIVDRAAMVRGVLAELSTWVLRVIAVEAAFIAPCDRYWLSGHIDLIYEPLASPGTIAMADWKTGAQKPAQVELDHGWEAGIYSAALRDGYFVEGRGRAREVIERELIEHAIAGGGVTPTHGVFPSQIHQVQLTDYVPYQRAGSRWVCRPEDLKVFGYPEPIDHYYRKGDRRGGAWMPVALRETDLTRLVSRLRATVGPVRMGAFPDRITELCARCAYRGPCLTGGYEFRGTDDQTALRALAELGDTL